MTVEKVLEVRAFDEQIWYDVSDYIVGELVFTEGYDTDTLSGVLPAISPSTLTVTIDASSRVFGATNKRAFASPPWIDRFSPGAQCRLRIGSAKTNAITRFEGTLVRRDDGDDYTYDTEWANDIWKLTSENKDGDPVPLINYTLGHMWEFACRQAGIPEDRISFDQGLGNTEYSIILRPGLDGIKQVQDLSGGIIIPTIDNKIHLQSYITRISVPSRRTSYEPGGAVSGTPIPPVKSLTSIFGVMNSLKARIFTFSPLRDAPEIVSQDMNDRYGIGEQFLGNNPSFPMTGSGSISIQTTWNGIISDIATLGFAGELVFDVPHQGIVRAVPYDLDIIDGQETDIDFDRPNARTFNGTYVLNYRFEATTPGASDVTCRFTIVISNANIRHDSRNVWLEFDYTSNWQIISGSVTDLNQASTVGPSFGIQGRITITNQHSTSFETNIYDYHFEDDYSIRKYGRKEREFPLDVGVHADHPISEDDYTPSASQAAAIARRARDELNLFKEPTSIYQALHTDETGILGRRLGDKETLNLERGNLDLFVGKIEHHFSGVLFWQVVYYWEGDFVQPFKPLPPPPAPDPFTVTATWQTRNLKVDITDADDSKGGVRYNVEIDTIDGSIPITSAEVTSVAAVSPATGFVATHTFTDSQANPTSNIGSVIVTREEDGYKVIVLRADFLGTYVPETTYPDFTITARWSGQNLLVAIAEADGTNKGNNTYKVIWSGGISGNTNVTTNAQGAVSYSINNAYGVTSIRITQIATGITKVLLGKDFTGTYTPAAFTTHWDRTTSRHSFYYKGWISDAPGGNGGVSYEISFEDVLGVTLTWSVVVSNSQGRVIDALVGHTRAITVIIVKRLSDGTIVRFPVGSSPPTTGETDSFPSYRFTATWNRSSLILRIVEILGHDDSGGTQFRFTTAGRTPAFSEERTTSVNGLITITIPNASTVTSVTATRTADSHTTTITRDHFFGTPVSGNFTTSISESYRSGSPDRYSYVVAIMDAPGVNSATQYRVEGTFAGHRIVVMTTTSAQIRTGWRAVVSTYRHSQGFSNITVTRLTDNTQISTDRPNFNMKASNNPNSTIVVDETDDGVRHGIRQYAYAVQITDPSSTVAGSIDYDVTYVQSGTTKTAPSVRTATNGRGISRFGTERTFASSVKVVRRWDGRTTTIPRSSFDRE